MSKAAIEIKKKKVAGLKEKIDQANLIVMSDYRSYTVKDITDLRKELFKLDAEFKVVKNTLLLKALKEAGFEGLDESITGPIAVLLGYKDPVLPLKALVDYVKDIEKGEVKAGIVEKKLVSDKDLVVIAKLPNKEVLLAKVVGGFQAPIYGLANVLSGTLRKLVYALNAVKEKKGGES